MAVQDLLELINFSTKNTWVSYFLLLDSLHLKSSLLRNKDFFLPICMYFFYHLNFSWVWIKWKLQFAAIETWKSLAWKHLVVSGKRCQAIWGKWEPGNPFKYIDEKLYISVQPHYWDIEEPISIIIQEMRRLTWANLRNLNEQIHENIAWKWEANFLWSQATFEKLRCETCQKINPKIALVFADALEKSHWRNLKFEILRNFPW